VRRRRRNPSELVSYSSTSHVAVGDHDLSGFEATLILGGILAVGGLGLWWWLRPSASASAVAPVAAAVPVQPVSPTEPGY
jgi:hypothetical protein